MNSTFRTLRRHPGFTALAALTIGLGAGAATAVFSVVDTVLLRPLPYPDSERLAMIWETSPATGRLPQNATPQLVRHWRERARSVESISAAIYWTPLLRLEDRSERVYGLRVSANMFETLGVQPVLGRTFRPEEDAHGAPRVAVIGDGLWRRRFAADRRILGGAVTLDGAPYTIVGVMPPGFRMQPAWGARAEIWTPLALDPEQAGSWGFGALRCYARLRSSTTLEAAQRELDGIAAQLNAEYPKEAVGRGAVIESMQERTVGDVRPALLMLMATVACLLLVACANLANLLLIRASRREKELSVRAAMGASRLRLAAHLLAEALSAGALGSLVALLVAAWGLSAIPLLLPESAQAVLPRLDEIQVDFRVLGFAAAVAILTACLAAMAPAMRLLRVGQQSLQHATRSATATRAMNRFRRLLIAGESALTLVLLCAAMLLLRGFVNLLAVEPGFRVGNTLTFVVSQPRNVAETEALSPARTQQLRQHLAALPGVRAAAAVNHIPVAGDQWGVNFHVAGVTPEDFNQRPRAVLRMADPHYLPAMGITLLSGRNLTAQDRDGSAPVVLINQALASRWFRGQDPVGKAIGISRSTRATVAGVYANTRQDAWGRTTEPEVLLPLALDRNRFGMSFVLHTDVDPAAMIETARRAIAGFDASLVAYDMFTMEEIRAAAVARPRFSLTLLAALAIITLALAIVGLFAVISYSVATRTREFGIRSAVGAVPRIIQTQVLGEGLRPVAAGAALGLAGAYLLMRHYSGLLYQVDPFDPAALCGSLALILSVAAAACWLPARRASQVHPATVLRDD